MRGGFVRFGLAMAASVLGAGGAAAQEVPGDDVTVTGQREIAPKTARRYVSEISAGVDGQLTRFNEPVCPTVIGIAEDYGRTIAQRIRTVAREAGAPVADEKCRGNLVVIFAKDADALVKYMRARTPQMFEGVDDAELKRAFREGPVHAWNTTEIRNEDGQRGNSTLTVRSASIINRSTQQAIIGSMIVLDHKATLGKTLSQLADYVAMRALAGALPPREGMAVDTILTLFDDKAAAPPQLSGVDRSYLRGLYSVNPTAPDHIAKGRISRQIQQDAKERGGVN